MTSAAFKAEVLRFRTASRAFVALVAALALLAVPAALLIQNTLALDAIHDAQLAACERGNVLRAELNEMIRDIHPDRRRELPMVDCAAVTRVP